MRARAVSVKPEKEWQDPPVIYDEGDACGIVSPATARRIKDLFIRKPGEKQALEDAVCILLALRKELPKRSHHRQMVESVLILLGKESWEL